MSGGQPASATERGGFLLFLGLVSLALLAVVLPFLTPMLWAALAAIMFQPLYRWFHSLHHKSFNPANLDV